MFNRRDCSFNKIMSAVAVVRYVESPARHFVIYFWVCNCVVSTQQTSNNINVRIYT